MDNYVDWERYINELREEIEEAKEKHMFFTIDLLCEAIDRVLPFKPKQWVYFEIADYFGFITLHQDKFDN